MDRQMRRECVRMRQFVFPRPQDCTADSCRNAEPVCVRVVAYLSELPRRRTVDVTSHRGDELLLRRRRRRRRRRREATGG